MFHWQKFVISKHGIDKVLEPFVEEMKTLHAHKLTHSIDSQNTVYDVGLLAFLADNLAAHQVGGFKESMSFAYRICRTCMATTEQTQTIFTEYELELRNPQKHAEQCSDLELPNASEFSKIHGINRKSILEDIPNFILFITTAKYFTLKDLNDRLSNFEYGYTEMSDRPSIIHTKPDTKLRQSAVQN